MPSLFCRMPLLCGCVLLSVAGCKNPAIEGNSPLSAVQMSPDSCVLEVFFVRFPLGDPELNDALWNEVDEQCFDVELRRQLGRNGFRVGLLGNRVPDALARLLALTDEPRPVGEATQINPAEWDASGPPARWHLEVRAAQRKVLIASDIYDVLPVLISEPGQVGGQSYTQAQAIFGVKTFPEPDGRVEVELVPEVQYGEVRQRYVGHQGAFRLETGKQSEVFEDMGMTATLSPGGMLLLGCLPERPGSLGYHFFTSKDGCAEQKLLVLRLAQTQHDGLFCPSEVLQLDE